MTCVPDTGAERGRRRRRRGRPRRSLVGDGPRRPGRGRATERGVVRLGLDVGATPRDRGRQRVVVDGRGCGSPPSRPAWPACGRRTSAILNVPLLSYISSAGAPYRPGESREVGTGRVERGDDEHGGRRRWRRWPRPHRRSDASAGRTRRGRRRSRRRARPPDAPRSRPARRPLPAEGAGRGARGAGGDTGPAHRCGDEREYGAGQQRGRRPSADRAAARPAPPRHAGTARWRVQAMSGTASAPAAMPTIATAAERERALRCVRPIAARVGWSVAAAATSATERLADEQEAAQRGDGGGDPQRRHADVDARDDRLARCIRRRHDSSPYGARTSSMSAATSSRRSGSARIVHERLDVGDLVSVGAGEALGELDHREGVLEVRRSYRVTATTSTSIVGPSRASAEAN